MCFSNANQKRVMLRNLFLSQNTDVAFSNNPGLVVVKEKIKC
jgi:hypothetical protein